MNQQRLNNYNDKIQHLIQARRLSAAFDALQQMLDEVIAGWEMREQLGRLRQSYSYMTQYALDGTDDPHRDEVYNTIVNGLMDLLAQINREVKAVDDTSLYFSTLRYEKTQTADSLTSLIERYRKDASVFSMTALASADNDGKVMEMRRALEQLERRIFNRVWVTYPLSADDEVAITQLIDDDVVDVTTRSLIVSALLLALLANYDERALYILLHTYYSAVDTQIKVRALSCFLIALSLYRSRRPGKRVINLLDTVREMPQWDDDVKMVSLQFIRTRDTEKINRKMRDEVIPEMLKLRPDIYKKINENPDALADLSSIDDMNPEWEDMLEKSGIADKMKELQEMQEEGADVMMSTFSHLKTYPFFNDVANWFLPFRPTHSSIATMPEAVKFGEIMGNSTFLCDSDKFSVVLSVASMPEAQRSMISAQFNMQNINLQEIKAASMSTPAAEREAEVNRYVHDLYRFFKLFRRKGEFNDPFATSLNLATVPLLSNVFDHNEHLRVVAEFYFKHGYYDDALALMRRLASTPGEADAPLFQKMGYAMQQLGKTAEALEYYRQAELLNADNIWTLRRIASSLRVLGKTAEALEYYRRIAELKPDDLNVALHLGHCYMELGKYKDALKQYFKVEFLDEKSAKALRPIAWCSFLASDYDRSRDYFGRIPADRLTPEDHLNKGHLEMATRHYRAALDCYRAALEAMGGDRSRFASMMQTDLHYLRSAGVEDFITGIVLDTLLN